MKLARWEVEENPQDLLHIKHRKKTIALCQKSRDTHGNGTMI
jgi:hypothetical protein